LPTIDPDAAAPPVAEKRPHSETVHGETRTDDYRWLRDKGTPAVTAYLEAENAYTDAVFLKPTEALRQKLYDEMLSHIQETDLSAPYPKGGYFYYARTEEGRQYPIQCRRKGSLDASEEVTLDLNALAEGEKFLSLGAYSVSDDANLLAYTTDVTGFREYTLRIKNLGTGELLPDRIEKVSGGVHWSTDGKYLFYATEDAAKRPYRVYRHRVGEADNAGDVLVHEETDGLYRAFVSRTRDKKVLLFGSAASTSTEYRWLPADGPTGTPTLVLPREPEHEYYLDHRDGLFYIRTNKGATNFRLVAAPVEKPSEWTEVVPHREGVALEDHDCFARHLVLTEYADGLPRLRVRDLSTGADHDIAFPEPTYSLSGDTNAEFDTDTFRFRYASLVTPPTVFDYGMATRERATVKETPVPNYDRTGYVSERVFATAADGTRVPISLVYKKGARDAGPAPTLLYGYGSYGIPMFASFNASRLALLDRGVVFAIGHIRGGGEFGKPWHDAGKMMVKKNTFTDFIACAEHLVASGYTAPEKLAILGGSAGGLLMGAVANLRPDLFQAVVSLVPFVDVINTMLDDTLPLTIGEYLEWGNPNEEPAYRYMLSYSPYDQLEAKAYPATLVRTSLNDSQVMYWEPAKYVAKLRTLKTDANPLLLHTNMAAGHGGSSGRYDALKETAIDYAFVLTTLGVVS
jgi:oligopeptidase B